MMSVPSISALTAGISLSACTQARTKKPMKPSFTPCFFSNRSRYCVRSAMTWLMSTSLKVVSMAAVFCASLSRRAMVWRSRVMRTRSSRAASSAGDGARTWTAAAGCATGVGCAAARSMAASMSPLVTRPSLPVPGTVAGIDAGFGGELAHRRRQRRRRQPAPLARRRAFGGGGCWRRRRGCVAGCGLRRRGAGAFLDLAEQRADGDGVAVLGGDVAEHAGGRRRHLDRHLVGLELDQRLVDRDRVARLLEPFADGRLGHQFAERGHADFSHDLPAFCQHPRWRTIQ